MQETHERAFILSTAPRHCVRGRFFDPGTDPVGVFLHGFRSDSQGVKARALARHAATRKYAWLRFDLFGHGGSDGCFAEFTVSTALNDVLAVITHLAPRPVVLIGSSLGAWLAILAATRTRVSALLLIAPAFNFVQNQIANLPAEVLARWRRCGTRHFYDPYRGNGFNLHYSIVDDAVHHDVLTAPVHLTCPLSIVHGEHDEIIPMSVIQRFAEHADCPGLRVNVVPGGDHQLISAIPRIGLELDRLWSSVRTL